MESVEVKEESSEASALSRRISSRTVVEALVFLAGVGFSATGWRSVAVAIGDGRSDWLFPALWFSGVAVMYLIGGMLFQREAVRIAFSVVVFAPSLLFTFSVTHLLFAGVGALLLFHGFRKMDDDVDSRIKLSFRKSMGMGIFAFSFSVSLLIGSAYYADVRSASWQELVPKFSLGEGTGDTVLRIAGTFYPEFGKIQNEGMTVDTFLESARQTGGNVPKGFSSVTEEQVMAQGQAESIEAGREELGRLVGRMVTGDEKMTDLFSEALRHKLLAFLSGAQAERNLPSSALPFVLSLLLFITTLSIASFLQGLWVVLAAIILRGLIRAKALSVARVPAEQEVLRFCSLVDCGVGKNSRIGEV